MSSWEDATHRRCRKPVYILPDRGRELLAHLELTGEGAYIFNVLQRAAGARGEIAVGARRTGPDERPTSGAQRNPGRDERPRLKKDDGIIALNTYQQTQIGSASVLKHIGLSPARFVTGLVAFKLGGFGQLIVFAGCILPAS